MRLPALLGLLCLFTQFGVGSASSATGDFFTRLRANDAPVGGRITIHAWFLDSLDAVVSVPGPGRVLALRFADSNGKDSFLVPADLALENWEGTQWTQGFAPLGGERLSGFLDKDEERWALWWVPDSLGGDDPGSLRLLYGFTAASFLALSAADAKRVEKKLPWELMGATSIDPDRSVRQLVIPPNPAAFDEPPRIEEGRPPEYPKSIRMYDFDGFVHVVALIDKEGKVIDAYVIETDAIHLLNVSALSAVMDWQFQPGRKSGRRVAGEIVVPVRFDR